MPSALTAMASRRVNISDLRRREIEMLVIEAGVVANHEYHGASLKA